MNSYRTKENRQDTFIGGDLTMNISNKKAGLVSVVIPTYNREQYICDALYSLKNQTYKNIEVIVIDDCSTDNTEKVIKKWNEENKRAFKDFVYLKLPRNRDEWWAWNIGFYIANGEYIAIHSSDDVSHKERIERQVNYLLENIDVAVVGSNYKVFMDSVNNIIGGSEWLIYDSNQIEGSYKENFEHCVATGTVMFRTDILDDTIGFRKVANNINDYYFISDIINLEYLVANMRDELYYVRKHEGQKSKKLEEGNAWIDDKHIPEALKTIKDRVSVVLTLENNSNTIMKTLESINDQTYSNIELIIVDNSMGSDIEKLVKTRLLKNNELRNGVIKDLVYFKLPRKVKYPWNYNIGAYLAKGDYILFHGEKGVSDKLKVEKQVEYLKANFFTSTVGTDYNNSSDFVKYDEDIEYSYVIDYMPCMNINTVMLRAYVINETGGLNRSLLGRESFEFIYRLLNNGYKVQNLREVLYYE
jgi:glycosyltransferase involved in cell wall biosynthesis